MAGTVLYSDYLHLVGPEPRHLVPLLHQHRVGGVVVQIAATVDLLGACAARHTGMRAASPGSEARPVSKCHASVTERRGLARRGKEGRQEPTEDVVGRNWMGHWPQSAIGGGVRAGRAQRVEPQ